MTGTKNVSAMSRIKEKSNHREGSLPLLLSRLVAATRMETITPTTAAISVTRGLFVSSGSDVVMPKHQLQLMRGTTLNYFAL